ncbi:MAG: hypothetical protein D6729_16175 [Deltaproteobacteria bacterium]|nr:MAG: hypothetical protein D6729_16175 [Deltaproteobacteria bacterium]
MVVAMAPALLVGGCANGTTGRSEEPDGNSAMGFLDAGQQERDWRPPAPFIGGTALIPLMEPLRCERYAEDAEKITFTWEPTGMRRVYAAVFDTAPQRIGGDLSPAPIWTWATGPARTDVGRLHWNDGFLPGPRSLPDESHPISTAPAPGAYWFVLWAWDEGRNLVASSEARLFYVDSSQKTDLQLCCGVPAGNDVRRACAPEVPPEQRACAQSKGDGGTRWVWPCYCDFLAAHETCSAP